MSRRPLRGLVASLVLHAALVAAVLTALPRSELFPALFVDLSAADPSEERAGPEVAPPTGARAQARAPDSAPPRESGRRAATPPPQPERLPESSAPTPLPSASSALSEAPAPPSPTSEPTAPVPIPPPPLLPAPALPPPPAASPGDAPASASSPPAPAPSAAAPAEPGPPSASAALNDGGGTVHLEPSPVQTRGRSALGDATGRNDASRIGVAVAPDLRGARPSQGDGASGGAGAGQALARRSPASEGGEAPQAVYTEYLGRLRQRVREALRYPPAARRRGLTGAVTIELTILPSGVIRDVSIVKSSSHSVLDEAAVETVRELRAQPFPANVPPRTLRVRLPVLFELR